jgi:hypothetical protein
VSPQLTLFVSQDRLPEEFEILDGIAPCSTAKLDIFLLRAKTFTSSTFSIVNVDQMCGKIQEKILAFLSDRGNESLGVRLHVIQRNPTILHTSAFVEGRNWDESILVSRPAHWKTQIIRSDHMKSVSIIASTLPGAGKTRFVRRRIDGLHRNQEGVQVGCVTVHEGTTADSLAADILRIFTEDGREKALHVSFMCLPSEKSLGWLQATNLFFQSLLIHGVVRSDCSSRSFHIGKGGWTIYVEFPSTGNGTDAILEWIRTHLPVLTLCGDILSPDNEFDIDPDTRRVATYLRAFEDGTIDRKFKQVSRNKRIVFVLDWSYSMRADMGNGQTALDVASDCALQIFDSHLHVNDVSEDINVLLLHG